MLTVCTWLWGDKFGPEDVRKLKAGVARNLRQPHRFLCVSDKDNEARLVDARVSCEITRIQHPDLTLIKGCYARLAMFSPSWQREIGVDDRLVCIDLDTVVTGELDPLFDRPEPFLIMQKGNASNPCPFNGALQMVRAGAHPEVWSDFTVEAAAKVPFYEFPDDQGWIWHKLPNAAGWVCGRDSGVFVFRKPGWPGFTHARDIRPDDHLPKGARLVTFSGGRSPQKFSHLQWVKQNWAA